ncbi:MAG: toll/interleukin-1 receptor domain-containing protein [Candidatus Binataceae bacterium]
MLDQEAMQIARKRLSADSSRRYHFFHRELQRVQNELATKGLGRSGALIEAIADVCAKEIEDATDRLWEVVRDLLREEDSALSPEAVRTLYGQIDELWVPYCSADPERQFETICERDGVSPSAKNATHFYDRSVSARMRIQSQVEEFIRSVRSRRSPDPSPNHEGRNPKVFLSHAASDEHIALLLKVEVERRLPGVKVFCSSDPADLPPGTKWSPEIQHALQESAMLIFVASDRGLQRPWVWFECGTFWFTDKKIMPLCIGEVRKNALRPPLSELQAINGDESSDLETGLNVVAAATGSTVSDASDLSNLSEKLRQLDREAAAVLNASSGWVGAEWKGKFLAYDGPYESLKEIGDRNFETSMKEALQGVGYRITLYEKNNFAAMDDANHFVQLTDRKSWRCRIVKGTAYLVATPT